MSEECRVMSAEWSAEGAGSRKTPDDSVSLFLQGCAEIDKMHGVSIKGLFTHHYSLSTEFKES